MQIMKTNLDRSYNGGVLNKIRTNVVTYKQSGTLWLSILGMYDAENRLDSLVVERSHRVLNIGGSIENRVRKLKPVASLVSVQHLNLE